MRHVFGFVLGVILAPALAYAAGWGFIRTGKAFDWASRTFTDRQQMYGAVGLMAVAGLAVGIIAAARWISPMTALVPALAYLGWTGYFLASPGGALNLPHKVPPSGEVDQGMQGMLAAGVFALIGLTLLVSALTGWRRRNPDEPGPEEYY